MSEGMPVVLTSPQALAYTFIIQLKRNWGKVIRQNFKQNFQYIQIVDV